MRDTYVAGPLSGCGTYQIGVNLLRSNLSEQKAAMFCRFVEDWCGGECMGDWRIEHSERSLLIIFDTDRDCVLFKLTSEWDYLRDSGPPLE